MRCLLKALEYILCKICKRRKSEPDIINEDVVIRKTHVQPVTPSLIYPQGLGAYLFECMKDHGTKIAQVYAPTGEVDQYCSLLTRCVRTAMKLKMCGVKNNDIICVYSDNDLDTVVPFLAATFIGTKVATFDKQLSNQDMSYIIMKLNPKFIFIDPIGESYIKYLIHKLNMSTKVVVFGEPSSHQDYRFSDFLKPTKNEEDFQPYQVSNINAIALIVFTAGATGISKGVLYSHKFVMYTSKNIEFSIYLQYSSLFHFSSILAVISIISSGGQRVICPDFRPKIIWSYVESYGVVDLMMSSYEAILLLDCIPKNVDCALQNIHIFGNMFPEIYRKRYRKLFPAANVCSIYGLTELGFTFQSINTKNQKYKDKLKSVGTILPNYHYKIVDLNSEILLGPNNIGELRIKSPVETSYIEIELSIDLYDENGFFKTGDIAYCDSDYNFYILDRYQNTFTKNHVTILPSFIEKVLLTHEAVQFVCVYGVPGDRDYNIFATIVLKQNIRIAPMDLAKYANEILPKDYNVKAIIFVDTLPLTPTGTVKRLYLQDEDQIINDNIRSSILFFANYSTMYSKMAKGNVCL